MSRFLIVENNLPYQVRGRRPLTTAHWLLTTDYWLLTAGY